MVMAAADQNFTAHKKRTGHHLLWLLVLVLAFAIYPAGAHAQIVGDLEVKIPFQFHAGNAKLPAGEYRIYALDQSDLSIMEISSVDGSTSALFQVQAAEANSEPVKSELIFNKYGNRYFLAKLFDEGHPSGNALVKSHYEKRIGQQAMDAEEHVPARHRMQQGK